MTVATVALLRHGGSHLIRPIVARLGFDIIEPGKHGAAIDQAEGPVIVFLRDPRDRMVATWRWWLRQPGKSDRLARVSAVPDEQLAWLLAEADGGFVAEMLRWAEIWCAWPNALTVRFEELRETGTREIARIAAHLGKPEDYQRDAAIWDAVFEKGRTFTGRYSDWREMFGPKSTAAWEEHGGPRLLELMGYDA